MGISVLATEVIVHLVLRNRRNLPNKWKLMLRHVRHLLYNILYLLTSACDQSLQVTEVIVRRWSLISLLIRTSAVQETTPLILLTKLFLSSTGKIFFKGTYLPVLVLDTQNAYMDTYIFFFFKCLLCRLIVWKRDLHDYTSELRRKLDSYMSRDGGDGSLPAQICHVTGL